MAQQRTGTKTPFGSKIPDVKSAVNDIKGSVAQPFALPRAPRTDAEAQRLYYHIRTLCYWLDAASAMIQIPFLDKLGMNLPFPIPHFGIEAIIGGLLPIAGDVIGGVLGLYIVLLCMQFGLPASALWNMFTNCIIDMTVGIIPIVGDLIDIAFKSNMRNLSILEDHLLSNPPPMSANVDGLSAPSTHYAVRIPPTGTFWPKGSSPDVSAFQKPEQHQSSSFFSNIFGSAGISSGSATNGWKLGGVKKVEVEQAGGWSGESARTIFGWMVGLMQYLFNMIKGLTGQGKQNVKQGKKKAF